MSKASINANAVVNGAEQTLRLYGVDVFRMQTRVFTVPGAAGRSRPMFIGKWTDRLGKEHHGGMADLLARPRIAVSALISRVPPQSGEIAMKQIIQQEPIPAYQYTVTVPLWIECKGGEAGTKGKPLSQEQQLFKEHVEANGEFYLHVPNDLRPLIDWLETHGLRAGGAERWGKR